MRLGDSLKQRRFDTWYTDLLIFHVLLLFCMEISRAFIFWLFVFVCHEDKNSAKYYFPTPEEKRKARIDVILMQIEQSHS